MTSNEKLIHHFKSSPVVWVPMWGLSKLRKRGGGFAGALEGKATFYDQWYARALSEETADKFAAMGVNLVILPFSVGGSSQIEMQERDAFQKMTEHLHKHNIVSLPYFQYQNILQEACELPDSEWAINLDGSRREYTYWRRTVCQSSRGFIDYFKGLVEDAVSRGADGIWIDNNYLAPCRCQLCEKNFRIYLAEEREDLLDLLYFEDFEKVEIPSTIYDKIQDPIMQAYLEFNCRRNIDIQDEIKDKLEMLLPEGLFASNPALYRGKNSYSMGVDIYRMAQLYDILYLENKLYPNVKDNFITGNFHGFISLAGLDCATVSGSWKGSSNFDSTVSSSSSGLPESRHEITRPIFEATAFNNIAGMFWAVRSRYHGICSTPEQLMQMYFEKEDINAWMNESLSTVKKQSMPKGLKNISDVAIFHSRSSMAFSHPIAYPALFCTEEMLLRNRIPYQILHSEDISNINAFAIVIIPEAVFMSDEEAQIIEGYVNSGGRLLVIGDCGLYNEYGFLREDYALKNACGVSYFDRPEKVIVNCIGKGKAAFLPANGKSERTIPFLQEIHFMPEWTDNEQLVISTLDNLNDNHRQIIVNINGNVGVSLSMNPEKIIVSLISYDEDPSCQSVTMRLRNDICANLSAQWLTDIQENTHVDGTKDNNDYIKFELENFRQFGCLKIGESVSQ